MDIVYCTLCRRLTFCIIESIKLIFLYSCASQGSIRISEKKGGFLLNVGGTFEFVFKLLRRNANDRGLGGGQGRKDAWKPEETRLGFVDNNNNIIINLDNYIHIDTLVGRPASQLVRRVCFHNVFPPPFLYIRHH